MFITRNAIVSSTAMVLVLASAPAYGQAQAEDPDDIVVTGTRIRSDGSASPVPLTVVSTAQLETTTPSTIADGLNKLPVFQGSQQPRRAGDGSQNLASNVLNLRNFGSQRTLVLLDGHRMPPSNANGTVSIDILPQMLVSRVDVVTAGASAVYGSDAVTGVVNFVLDHKFKGLKLNANAGLSDYGDGFSYRMGAAFGSGFADDRGHFEISYERFKQKPVANFDRPYGPGVYVLTGSGTAANPFRATIDTRRADSTFGGRIAQCSSPCPATGQQFLLNGAIGPFNPGVTTGTSNQNSGGDGAYSPFSTALVGYQTDTVFGRLDYDLTDDIHAYLQGGWSRAYSSGWHFPAKLTPYSGASPLAASTASVFFKNNPFLSAAARAALGDNGASNATNTFSLGTYFTNLGEMSQTGTQNANEYWHTSAGLEGKLGALNWDVYYSHGQNVQRVTSLNNSNYQRQFAALDAVVAPDGTVKCFAATQAATAAAYSGCVPLNAFGPNAVTPQMFSWFTGTTWYSLKNVMDDMGGSLTGTAFDGWAGPIRFAVSGELRFNKLVVDSNANPTAKVDCTGLRICNPGLALWAQPVLAPLTASNRVWEISGELDIPLLKDAPLFNSLTANLAGRHTDYSTSGSVQTWKAGLIWDVSSQFRLRGTASVDIRAPTLIDLFQPSQAAVSGFVDLHTSTSNTVFFTSKGNPGLKPEKAHTYALGAIFRPKFLPGLMASVDFYSIKLDNAITVITPANTDVQQLCEASNGTSEYCGLIQRPLAFSDRSPANFPTAVFTQNLNVAMAKVRGFDVEFGYSRPGWEARVLVNHQPTNISQNYIGAPISRVAASKTRITASLTHTMGDLTVNLQDRWLSGFDQAIQPTQVYAQPRIPAFNSLDLNLEYQLRGLGDRTSVFFTVQNLFNEKAPLAPLSGSVGINYPVPAGYDIMGRYFTVGARAKF